jgi:hypothetical protein
VQNSLEVRQARKEVAILKCLRQRETTVDVHLFMSFRIWQKALLEPRLDRLKTQMFESQREIIKKRLGLLAKNIKLMLHQSFKKWLIRVRILKSINIVKLKYPVQYGFLNLQNVLNKKQLNAMRSLTAGQLSPQANASSLQNAFLIWKCQAKIDLTYEHDS